MTVTTERQTAPPDATPTVAIRNWMGQKAMAGLVWEEVKQANFERRNDGDHTEPVMNKRGEILLGILTYAYATGLYRSQEIENELMRSPAAQQFFAHAPLTGGTLRHFRRCNRELVKSCVGKVLGRAWQASMDKAAAPGLETVSDGRLPMTSAAACNPLAVEESEHRLEAAAVCDWPCPDLVDRCWVSASRHGLSS